MQNKVRNNHAILGSPVHKVSHLSDWILDILPP